jgi:hypothetical protein
MYGASAHHGSDPGGSRAPRSRDWGNFRGPLRRRRRATQPCGFRAPIARTCGDIMLETPAGISGKWPRALQIEVSGAPRRYTTAAAFIEVNRTHIVTGVLDGDSWLVAENGSVAHPAAPPHPSACRLLVLRALPQESDAPLLLAPPAVLPEPRTRGGATARSTVTTTKRCTISSDRRRNRAARRRTRRRRRAMSATAARTRSSPRLLAFPRAPLHAKRRSDGQISHAAKSQPRVAQDVRRRIGCACRGFSCPCSARLRTQRLVQDCATLPCTRSAFHGLPPSSR